MRHPLFIILLAVSCLSMPIALAHAASYTFTTLDVPHGRRTLPHDINAVGQIVGFYDDLNGNYGFLYADGLFTTLPEFPGAIGRTQAYGINHRGHIVGTYSFQTGGTHGFLYEQGVFTSLKVPVALETFPFGINDVGEIVGIYQDASGQHGFLHADGVFTSLDTPGAVPGSTIALSVNNSGQVVGIYEDHTRRAHGFLYVDGVFTTFPEVPFPGALNTSPSGINDRGQIIGTYNDLSGGRYGFLYETGVFTPVDVPSDVGRTNPLVINNRGEIVGFYTDVSGGTHGFLATPQKK